VKPEDWEPEEVTEVKDTVVAANITVELKEEEVETFIPVSRAEPEVETFDFDAGY